MRFLIHPMLILVAAGGLACARSDARFVESAASGGLLEVQLGRHAMESASDPRVRAFGERMVMDHSAANAELSALATREDIELPKDLSGEHARMRDRLSALRGSEFDREYMTAMIEDHENDVKAFRRQADRADSEIDRWAASKLPLLETHLQQARDVAAHVGDVATAPQPR